MKEIFNHAFVEKKDETLLTFTSWAVWNQRNQIQFKESACPLDQILPLAKERKREFQSLHPATMKMQHQKYTRWKPSDREFYKVNYDGVVFKE